MEDNFKKYIHIIDIAADWWIFAINKTLQQSYFKSIQRMHGAFSDRLTYYKYKFDEEETIRFKENLISQLLDDKKIELWNETGKCTIGYSHINIAWNNSVKDSKEFGYLYYSKWYPNVKEMIINNDSIIIVYMNGIEQLIFSLEWETNKEPLNSR
jgi:hypothetical protein